MFKIWKRCNTTLTNEFDIRSDKKITQIGVKLRLIGRRCAEIVFNYVCSFTPFLF